MLKHKLSNRELVLLLIVIILGLGLFYYSFILKSYNEALVKYDTANMETELSIYEAKYQKYEQMKTYVSEHHDDYVGSVVTYDNLVNLLANFANDLDNKVSNISITMDDPLQSDTIVRRMVTVSFAAKSNEIVKDFISSILNSDYRVIINKVQVSKSNNNLVNSNRIEASYTLTFFETTKDAKYDYGLVSQE